MRRGFRLTLFAAGLGLTWVAWKIIQLVLLITADYIARAQILEDFSPAAIIVGTIGCVFATLATTLAQRMDGWRTQLALYRLRPLWSLLISAQPQVQLPPTALHGPPEYRLYRQLVEIRDAQIALGTYVPPELARWAAEISDEHRLNPTRTQRVAEAACLLTALDAHQAGHRHARSAAAIDVTAWSASAAVPRPLDEASWLIGVYRAMRHDHLVARLRRRSCRVRRGSTECRSLAKT
jgi:hypothetical protein